MARIATGGTYDDPGRPIGEDGAVSLRIVERRPGDLAEYFADPALARKLLGWQAQLGIDTMCADTWRWQRWAAENASDLE